MSRFPTARRLCKSESSRVKRWSTVSRNNEIIHWNVANNSKNMQKTTTGINEKKAKESGALSFLADKTSWSIWSLVSSLLTVLEKTVVSVRLYDSRVCPFFIFHLFLDLAHCHFRVFIWHLTISLYRICTVKYCECNQDRITAYAKCGLQFCEWISISSAFFWYRSANFIEKSYLK